MKACILTFLSILLFIFPAFSQQHCKVFTEPKTGVSICFPDDWQPRLTSGADPDSTLVELFEYDRWKGDAVVFVFDESKHYGVDGQTVETAAQRFIADVLSQDLGTGWSRELLGFADFGTDSGLTGKRVSMRMTSPKAVTKMIYYLFKTDGQYIAVTAYCEISNDKMEKTFDRVLRSFSLGPTKTVPERPE